MAIGDELDQLLSSGKLDHEDWDGLAKILEVNSPSLPITVPGQEFFNKEIRHNYGHSAANLFRNCYEPDYQEILRETATKLDVNVKDHHTTIEIEDKLIIEVVDRAKAQIIKVKGIDAWRQIEKDVEREIDGMIERGDLPPGGLDELKKARGPAIMAALYAGRLAGFALYQVAIQTLFQIAKLLGLRVGVAVAGPIVGGVLAVLLGPVGWLLAGLTLIYDLGDTNWKKTVPSIVTIAILRRKHGFY